MKIKSKSAISIETTVDVVVEVDEIPYRFRVVVTERPNHPAYVRDIDFSDKIEVYLEWSLEKEIRKFIKEQFEK